MTQSNDSPRIEALTNALNVLLQNQDLLTRRVAHLESLLQIKAEAPHAIIEPTPEPVPVAEMVETPALAPAPEPEEIIAEPPVSVTPQQRDSGIESKVGLTLVNRIGAITLVLGIAFFFKWAVDNNWIGPAGQ